METKILVAVFFMVTLLIIGLVTALMSKYFAVRTTADSATAKGIIVWGCLVATVWLIYGGLAVALYLMR